MSADLKKIIFINSHPIQYFAPLYKYLNDQGLHTSCWYCSDENVKGHRDREFGTAVQWDIPLLDGYPYRFFKNFSWKPSLYHGFFGLMNVGMIRALFKEKKSIVIVHGWAYVTNILVVIAARLRGHTVCLRAESPLHQELLKSKLNRFVKKILLQGFLFRFVHRFMYIGAQNRAFYEYYGVKQTQLVFVPYTVDNDRFQLSAKKLLPLKSEIRTSLTLPVQSKIILFTAKFIQKKRPLDLLKAFEKRHADDACLVMVGDGELRPAMESFIREKGLKNVYLPGFINQSEIVKYYAAADVFVLCSEAGETWGLSVNEAMNFGLPVVVADMVGCSFDLVKEAQNGFTFLTGNTDDLESNIAKATQLGVVNNDNLLRIYSYYGIYNALSALE